MVIIMMSGLTNALHLGLAHLVRQGGVPGNPDIVAVPVDDFSVKRFKNNESNAMLARSCDNPAFLPGRVQTRCQMGTP